MDNVYNGIDVSRWQGTIHWPDVKAAGIQFAMIRVGYCNNAGSMIKDVRFEDNIAGAIAAGLDVGGYVYSYATTAAAAAVAARETLALVQNYPLTYPVAFDIEDAINIAMTPAQNTAISIAFLSAIAEEGYCPLLYTYRAFAETRLNMSELADYDFWLAHITSQTGYTGPYTMWQYSWTGTVDGISGDVDLNYSYKDYPSYIRKNGLNGFSSSDEDNNTEPNGGGDDRDEGNDSEGNGDHSGTETPDESQDISYVVVKNDTLYHIAQHYGLSLQALIQANPQIRNPNLIYPGDIIHIPRKSGSVE